MNNSRQISICHGTKKLLEVNDNMSINDYSENGGVIGSTVHSKYSKIKLVALDWSKGNKDKAVVTSFNLDIGEAKVLFGLLADCNTAYFGTNQGYNKIPGYVAEKIGYKKLDGNFFEVNKIWISHQPNMTNKWKVVIEIGKAEKSVAEDGKTTIKKGTYQSTGKVDIYLSDFSAMKMANEVLSYISSWENTHFNEYLSKRTKYEINEAAKRKGV